MNSIPADRPSWATLAGWNLWMLVVAAAAACAIVWLAAVERTHYEYAEAIREAGKQNTNLTIALEEHSIRSLNSVKQALTVISMAYLRDGDRLDLEKLLDADTRSGSMVVNFGVADDRGGIVSSRGPSLPDPALDGDLLRAHRDEPDPDMLIRVPTRRGAEWAILTSKRIVGNDGSFAGVAFVSINPRYFTQFYGRADLGREGQVTLLGLDGIVRARRVGDIEFFGQDMRGSALMAAQARQPTGTFMGAGSDGVQRIYSYRTLSSYPMLVSVATAVDTVLAESRLRARYYYLGAGVSTLLILFGTGAIVHFQSRQRRAMLALSRQRTVLSTVQEALLDGLLLVDSEGHIVSYNDKFIEIWRVPKDLVLAGDDRAVVRFGSELVEDPGRFAAKVRDLYEHPDEASHDLFRFKDGRTIDRYSAPVVGADGAHYGRVWLFRDITERQKQEEDLLRSEQRFRQLAESIEQVFWIATPDLQAVTYVSPAFERLTGRPPQELTTNWRLWLESVHPDDRLILSEAHAGLAVGKPYDIEYRFRHVSGREVWINDRGYPLRDAAGVMIHATGVSTDITSRKQAEEQLRLSAQAFESIADGVIVTDASRHIVSVNRAYCVMSGYEPDELLGKRPRVFQSGRHDAAFYDEMWDRIHTEGSWRGEMWSRRRDGQLFPELVSIGAVKDRAGTTTHYVGVATDISEVKRYEDQLEHQARHDSLTGLGNRLLFEDRFGEALIRAQHSGTMTAVLFIDLDKFKDVNESLGHVAGDALLQAWAKRLTGTVRRTDTVARFGGDEFAVLLESVTRAGAETIAGKVVEAAAIPFEVSGHRLFLTVSIGISLAPDDGKDTESLLKNADSALYQAKSDGRNGIRFFTPDMHARAFENLMLVNALRLGLDRDELVVRYQPCVELATGRIKSVEALVAWNHPELGILPPGRFIPLAEETGLIEAVGERVLEIACRQMRQWHDAGVQMSRVAVNLSARQFRLPDLPQRIGAMLAANGLRGEHIELEVTESIMMQNPERATGLLLKLKALGIQIAIDDFGTGYSSLSYLKSLPIDCLKIDKSFVNGVPLDADDVAIIRAIIAMAKSLGHRLIAEGIETGEQRDFLTRNGCDAGQGWLFGKALPHDEITALLATQETAQVWHEAPGA